MKQDFSKKKVGDKMWSIQLGECQIIKIDFTKYFPIRCENELGIERTYSLKGCYEEIDKSQSLFESNPFENQFQEREMEVSDDGVKWVKRKVLGIVQNKYITEGFIGLLKWNYAREIKQENKKVVTLELTDEQIESLKKQGILCQN